MERIFSIFVTFISVVKKLPQQQGKTIGRIKFVC